MRKSASASGRHSFVLKRRIELFAWLPVEGLNRLAIQKEVDRDRP